MKYLKEEFQMKIKVEEFYFGMASFNQVFIGRTAEELYNALYYRHYPYCEVAVFPRLEEAHLYVTQRYHVNLFSNPYLYGYAPMPLPIESKNSGYNIRAKEFVEITADSSNEIMPANFDSQQAQLIQNYMPYAKPIVQQNVNEGLFWAIDAINGFAVVSDIKDLISVMLNESLSYAHAIPFGDEWSASVSSRASYLNRFACRYDFKEIVNLPTNPIRSGEIFVDCNYEERESRCEKNKVRNQLLSVGLL